MKKIYLVDINSFIYRMFFALPEFSRQDWKIVNAIFWIAKFFVWQLSEEKPDYLFIIKDSAWKNFRHDLYSGYKITRDKMPDNLKSQIKDIEEMILLMWIKIISIKWYEADDVIASISTKLSLDKQNDIFILTWDKDLYSLVSDNVRIYDTMKKQKFWLEETLNKFWVSPKMIIDYLAIVGDKADNIPWIAWFWEKKAIDLINTIWSIENIYNLLDNILSDNIKIESLEVKIQAYFKWKSIEKLINSRDNAFLSKKLAKLDLDILDLDIQIEDYKFDYLQIKNPSLMDFFIKMDFKSLFISKNDTKTINWKDLDLKVDTIKNKEELDNLYQKILSYDKLFISIETKLFEKNTLNPNKDILLWIVIYLDDNNIYYINKLDFSKKSYKLDLINFFKKLYILDILIVGSNLKYDLELLDLFIYSI